MNFGDGDHCQSHGSVAKHLCNPVALFAVHADREHWPTEDKAYNGNTGWGSRAHWGCDISSRSSNNPRKHALTLLGLQGGNSASRIMKSDRSQPRVWLSQDVKSSWKQNQESLFHIQIDLDPRPFLYHSHSNGHQHSP